MKFRRTIKSDIKTLKVTDSAEELVAQLDKTFARMALIPNKRVWRSD